MLSNNTILKVGDWIKGKTRDGELVIGYIESLDIFEEKINVTITSSDNEDLASKTIPLPNQQVTKIPEAQVKNRQQLEYLIDLALATGDQEWFMELSDKLNAMKVLVKDV